MNVLDESFYLHDNVVEIARSLIGKALFTSFNGRLTGGIITETEAYAGAGDRACHAYQNRRTKRTEVMFHRGGVAYVYLCYGMHNLLNVVTNKENTPHAVLIRSIVPDKGLDHIAKRRKKTIGECKVLAGPGVVCQGLGITRLQSGLSFSSSELWIEDREELPLPILQSTRIGVDYAGEDALLPWRFYIHTQTRET